MRLFDLRHIKNLLNRMPAAQEPMCSVSRIIATYFEVGYVVVRTMFEVVWNVSAVYSAPGFLRQLFVSQ